MIRAVAFVQSIPILGTGKREDRFEAPEWEIDLRGLSVWLRRPESQNVPEVPAFEVRGVGHCIPAIPLPTFDPADFPDISESTLASGSSDSKAAEAPAGNPADAGANPAPTTEPTKLRKGRRS